MRYLKLIIEALNFWHIKINQTGNTCMWEVLKCVACRIGKVCFLI